MTIETPCILLCSIDERTGYCFGCGRSGGEIAAWMEYSDEERRALMAELPARLETIERRPRRQTRRQRLKAQTTASGSPENETLEDGPATRDQSTETGRTS
ncbi:DUF1289 domain-containing protein [Pseudohoeflea sp. DP4N28-3]|uniref:DUF1289 domain-containing protein n=1 Tax=Pseudohoeflea coraliihabitans TaxID=2860393 RepID=A0ABS6WPW9_9HYPH|nr:DUF1289 domain-containing protein [Pseudohoeflea sp. DP4N28-3]